MRRESGTSSVNDGLRDREATPGGTLSEGTSPLTVPLHHMDPGASSREYG